MNSLALLELQPRRESLRNSDCGLAGQDNILRSVVFVSIFLNLAPEQNGMDTHGNP